MRKRSGLTDILRRQNNQSASQGHVETSLSKVSSNSHFNAADRKKKAARSARKVGEALKVGRWRSVWVCSPARSQSKYRLYTNDDLRVLRRAMYLRRVQGLNAPAILNQLKKKGCSTIAPR
jgi:hypothetical protein